MIATKLVLPDGLASQLAGQNARGYLEGAFIKSESLFVAYGGVVDSSGSNDPSSTNLRQERVHVAASQRTLMHWAFAQVSEEIARLPYVIFKEGLEHELLSKRISTPADLDLWTHDQAAIEPPEGARGVWSLCALEKRGAGTCPLLLLCTAEPAVYSAHIEIIPEKPDLPVRLDGLAPVQALRSKRVAVVGLGSGGSMAALALAAGGVGTLHLLDHDHLSVDNVFRHACGIRHVGRPKVLAVRDLIAEQQLPAIVTPHVTNVVSNAEALWKLISEVDLMVCATDNLPSRRLCNYICVHTATPLVLGCALHNALIGEIIRVMPGRSACYECTRDYLRASGALLPLTPEEVEAEEVPYDAPTQIPTAGSESTGTRVDVSLIAALLSRVVITSLLQDVPEVKEPDLPFDYMAWGVSTAADFPDPFAFALPFSVNWLPITRRDGCIVCGQIGQANNPETEEVYKSIMGSLSGQSVANKTSETGD